MCSHPLPAGCHDAKSAAKLLNMGHKKLLKKMREIGWLMNGPRTKNLPYSIYAHNGYLTTQLRDYEVAGIKKQYQVMLLTQKGYEALKKIIGVDLSAGKDTTNFIFVTGHKYALKLETSERRFTAAHGSSPFCQSTTENEREKFLKQMEEWDIPLTANIK